MSSELEDNLHEKEVSLEYYTTQIHLLTESLRQIEIEIKSYWAKANQIGTEIVRLREALVRPGIVEIIDGED